MTDGIAHAAHLIQSFTVIGRILGTISIGLGVAMFVGGLLHLKRYGEMRTFMSHQMTLWAPLSRIFAGVFFLILPAFAATGLLAFWGTSNPLHYSGGSDTVMDHYIPAINMFVRLVGIGAIMRAISLLARSGSQQSQPGSLSRAVFFLFSGVLCVHIVGSARLFQSIFNFF